MRPAGTRVVRGGWLVGAVGLLAAGCSANSAAGPSELTVFAASSLTGALNRLGRDFEEAHPGTTIRFDFAGSSDLAAQLEHGAQADVFASADQVTMDRVVSEGLVAGRPVVFATNTMMIAVPPGNPGDIGGVADLGRPGVKVVVCAPAVPCGAATEKVEANTGVDLHPVSEEASVTDVLGKVVAGEADAGVVYVTDVKTAGDTVEGVPIPLRQNAVNTYPIAVMSASPAFAAAQEFQAFVVGPEGRKTLVAAGFGAP